MDPVQRAPSHGTRRQAGRDAAQCPACQSRQAADGRQIVGREILIQYTDDMWYVAVVVAFDQSCGEHKIVYVDDDALEVLKLSSRWWMLMPKRKRSYDNLILKGAVIEFIYPGDGRPHRAMIYDHSVGGDRLKVAYLNEIKTDMVYGGGWDVVSQSPCVAEKDKEEKI